VSTSAAEAPVRSDRQGGLRNLLAWTATRLDVAGISPSLARYALAVFALSRLGFVLLTVAALRFLRPNGGGVSTFVDAWARYDATYYARLARDGYQASVPWREAFFPLQPLLTRIVMPLVGGNIYVAGMVVSNLCFLVALLGMGALAVRFADERLARRAILYLTLFPTGLFFFAGYADSLFLAAAIWCLVATRNRAWWLAGVLGMLAALTRQMGLFLALPFVYEYASATGWQLRSVRSSAAWGLLIPGGLVLFMAWLSYSTGDPLGFVHAERFWQHATSAPWATLIRALQVLPHQPDRTILFKDCVDLAAVVLFAVLIVAGVRLLSRGDTAYSAAIWLLALIYPTAAWPLQSDARYLALAFPCFLVLAWWGRHPRVHAVIAVTSCLLLALMAQYYVRGAIIL